GECKPIQEAPANVDHNLFHCGKDQVSCYSKRSCLSFTQICNRQNDCNNEDEAGCDCDGKLEERSPAFTDLTSTSITWILDDTVFSNFSYADAIAGLHLANLTWIKHQAESSKRVTVSGLKPAQEYSFVFNYKNRRCKTEPVTVLMGDGLPSEPEDVTAKVKHEYNINGSYVLAVNVTWKPPKSPRGTILFYVIYHQQIHNDGTSASEVFESTRTSYDISGMGSFSDSVVENIEAGKTYQFWVAAATKAGVGAASGKHTLNISPGPDKSLIPTFKVLNNTTLNLKWHQRPEVKSYKISVTVNDPIRGELDMHAVPDVFLKAPADHYKIKDLCPGSTVHVTLAATYGDSVAYETHPRDTLFTTMGGALPEVNVTNVELSEPTSFLVSYKVVHGQVLNKNYLVYYTHDLTKMAKIASVYEDTTYKLKHLLACERYYLWVRPAYPSCPASRFSIATTQEDLTAPPKDVVAEALLHKDYYNVKLTWEPSCGHHDDTKLYIIAITKANGEEGFFQVNSTTFTFRADPGETYTFRVRAKTRNARPSDPVMVTIPSLDGPINLIMQPDSEHKVFVRWDWPPRWDTPDFKEYVLHTKGPGGLELTNHTANSEIFLHLARDGQYTFSVDVKDKKDKMIAKSRQPARYMYESHAKKHSSDESHMKVPQPQPQPSSSMSHTHLIAIIVPVTLVVVALSAALVFFIVRHKRLQRSFLAFANSHYNIQSGTTTFSDDLDGDEPLIQGFSDDEPLVIA
ncbi:sortilin-related receptor, partial [Elysia marginata]